MRFALQTVPIHALVALTSVAPLPGTMSVRTTPAKKRVSSQRTTNAGGFCVYEHGVNLLLARAVRKLPCLRVYNGLGFSSLVCL